MFSLDKFISKLNLRTKISLIILIVLIPLIIILLTAMIIYSHRVYKLINTNSTDLTNNVYNILEDFKFKTKRYSSTLSDNLIIRRNTYFKNTGVLSAYLESLMDELNVNILTIHNKNGLILARGHAPKEFNIIDRNKYHVKTIEGNKIFAIDKIGKNYLFFSIAPIYHHANENIIIGTITVGYKIDSDFLKNIKKLSGTNLLFVDKRRLIASTFDNFSNRKVLPENYQEISLNNIDYDLIEMPIEVNKIAKYSFFNAVNNSNIRNSLKKFIGFVILIFVIAMVLSVMLVLKIANNINKSKNKIMSFSKEILNNNYDTRVKIDTEDEFNALATVFNKMAENVMINFERIKKQRDEIEIFKNNLSNIIDSMPSILISINKKGIIQRWNKAAEAFTGIESAVAKGKKLGSQFPTFKRFNKYIKKVIDEGESFNFSKEKFGNEEVYYFDIVLFPIRNKNLKEMLIRANDVTDMHNKDMELKQIQKMETVGSLASGFAHDLNNILGGIIGTLSILEYKIKKGKDFSKEELSDRVESMINISHRAEDLIDKLLTLSRKKEMKFLPVDINEIIEDVISICRNSLDKRIKIKENLLDRRVLINADRTQIEQAILNICINGEQAMTKMKSRSNKSPGSVLLVELETIRIDRYFARNHPKAKIDEDYCIVSVSDEGIGMDEETKKKIFEPFYTNKEEHGGTGLGLTMVYNIITQHNGFIDFYSEVDRGTTFNLYFPLMEKKGVKVKSDEYNVIKGEGSILVVDDEKIMREVAKSILEECNYKVFEARNGGRGLKKI